MKQPETNQPPQSIEEDVQDHLRLFNQNINKEYFDGVYLQSDFAFPALILTTKTSPTKLTFKMFVNTNSLKEGDTTLYFRTEKGSFVAIGKVDYAIDIVYNLEQIFKNYKPSVYYIASRDLEPEKVVAEDLLGTLKI